jgi:hypothetical protein
MTQMTHVEKHIGKFNIKHINKNIKGKEKSCKK